MSDFTLGMDVPSPRLDPSFERLAAPHALMPRARTRTASRRLARSQTTETAKLGSLIVFLALSFLSAPAHAADWFVAAGGSGRGTRGAPFGRIQDAIDVALPGDVVNVSAGTYAESLRTVRAGREGEPITVRAEGERGAVQVTAAGRVLTVAHPHFAVRAIVFDGQYGFDDIIRVQSAARGFTLREGEVRRTSRDAIDIGAAEDVLIEDSLIHHALNATGGRTDAHGIVAGAVRGLTIRNTEIHTFSGDAFQVDPRRAAPGWTDVLIQGCRFWLAPLRSSENGFAQGTVTGENAVDTKAAGGQPRSRLTIRDTEAHGFRGGLITNMAAFNLKENIDALIDGVTVFDSEIAFRMRGARSNGGAQVRIQNAVVHSTAVAFRYEDDIESPRIYNVTVGSDVERPFDRASSSRTALDVRNFLMLGRRLPREARLSSSNLAVAASSFRDAPGHDYRLRGGSPAIDAGEAIESVTLDRDSAPRPQGVGHDIGAYERGEGRGAHGAPASRVWAEPHAKDDTKSLHGRTEEIARIG